MVDTSSLSGVRSASRFDPSDSSNSGFGFDRSNNPPADSDQAGSKTPNLVGIEALSNQPSTAQKMRDASTGLDNFTTHSKEPNNAEVALEAVPSGLAGAGQALARDGYNLQVDNPQLIKMFESTESAWTGKGGFTKTAEARLTELGITVEDKINEPPQGAVNPAMGKAQGIGSGKASNINGKLAEQQIADRFKAQGLEVEEGVTFDKDLNRVERSPNIKGDRDVDVLVHKPHPSEPRLNQEIHIESKAFRVNNTDSHLKPNQISHDVRMLENNQTLRASGVALERTGRVLRPVGIALDTVSVAKAIHKDGGIGVETGRTVTGIAGGAAGGWSGATSGAAVGASVGSAFPVVGTVAGGVIGGIIGGLGGAAIGEKLATSAFDSIKSWFN